MNLDDVIKQCQEPQSTTSSTEKLMCTYQKTLRDEFAMAALTGYMMQEDNRTLPQGADPIVWRKNIARDDAEYCYRIADAMLKAREGR